MGLREDDYPQRFLGFKLRFGLQVSIVLSAICESYKLKRKVFTELRHEAFSKTFMC